MVVPAKPTSGGVDSRPKVVSQPPVILPSIPDLIIPSGRVRLTSDSDMTAELPVSDRERLRVILPAGTVYELLIGTVERARWRTGDTPAGVWSFYAQVGDEKLWLEESPEGWVINHNLPPIDSPDSNVSA